MTDETLAEIVRLARKQWPVDEIRDQINRPLDPRNTGTWPVGAEPVTTEQVQQVIDEASGTVPETSWNENDPMRGQPKPQDTDPIGRIAKWLDDSREAGYTSREQAEMLVQAIVLYRGPLLPHKHEGIWLADQLDAMAEGRHDKGCDCETCMYEARQSGKPDPRPGRG